MCDESHLTGESRPEEKQKGGKVLAGAMVTEVLLSIEQISLVAKPYLAI